MSKFDYNYTPEWLRAFQQDLLEELAKRDGTRSPRYFMIMDLADCEDEDGNTWKEDVLAEGHIFLTRKHAQEYLDHFGYNHHRYASTYAYHAYRSPDYQRLVDFLARIDLDRSTIILKSEQDTADANKQASTDYSGVLTFPSECTTLKIDLDNKYPQVGVCMQDELGCDSDWIYHTLTLDEAKHLAQHLNELIKKWEEQGADDASSA